MHVDRRFLVAEALLVLLLRCPCLSQDARPNSPDSLEVGTELQEVNRPRADVDVELAKSEFLSLQKSARAGDLKAMIEVANCYADGRGVAKDLNLSHAALRIAVETGSDEALFQAARSVLDRGGASRGNAFAMKWLHEAAENNHLEAIGYLTEELFHKYLNDGKNAAELLDWSKRGSLNNLPLCQRILGYCCQNGVGQTADPALAFHYYSKASENEDVFGAICLGFCYLDGIGIAVDETKAVEILRDAAKTSNEYAIYEYAVLLDQIVADNRVDQQSFDPLRLATRNRNSDLTAAYRSEIVRQLKRAVELEYTPAMNLLASKLASGVGCEANHTMAFELAKQSEALGDLEGGCKVAEFYQNGIGTAADPREAAAIYARLAKQGSALAQYRFGLCLASGQGVGRNMVAGRNWILRSASQGFAEAVAIREQMNARQMEEWRGWLDSMFSGDIVSDSIQRRINEYNFEQERSSWNMEERQRIGL